MAKMQTEANMLEIQSATRDHDVKILVIGVGGGGNNAVNRMIQAGLKGVSYAAVNTDIAVLNNSMAELKVQIGKKLLSGYGAGADPTLGQAAAEENEDELRSILEDVNMAIVTAGMGGGTGTGAAPYIAKLAKQAGILTVGVVTKPFFFEGVPRQAAADNGIEKLKDSVDTLLVIPNDKLMNLTGKPLMLEDAFVMADSVLRYTVEGISNIVYNEGLINIDFNDVKSTLSDKGRGHLGIGIVEDGCALMDAFNQAINSPLLETNIQGASNILINTSGRVDVASLSEAINYVRELAGEKVNINWGTVTNKEKDADKIVVTLIATGMPQEEQDQAVFSGISKSFQSGKMPAKQILPGNPEFIVRQDTDVRPNPAKPANTGSSGNIEISGTSGTNEKSEPGISIPPFIMKYQNRDSGKK